MDLVDDVLCDIDGRQKWALCMVIRAYEDKREDYHARNATTDDCEVGFVAETKECKVKC